ncbi:MAG TPA: M20/M25/M40 family metallo-hydrolase [Armatimonadetes bacterium]|nr:M20/M25/M40 family metallo-hydrolase [Armatimonadota bacterium]
MSVNEERILHTFLDLLRIPSCSGEEREIVEYLKPRLTSLGFQVWEDEAGKTAGSNANNLIAHRPGNCPAPALLFNAHLDTVQPTGDLKIQVEEGVVRSDGTTILGGDDKTGVTAVLEALAYVCEHDLPHGDLTVVYTICEENGLRGAKALDLSSLSAQMGFVFDGGTPIGTLTVSAPTHRNLRAVVHGRAAHAGVHPEQGLNAIVVASSALSAMRLGRIDEETTANIGVIHGGQARNIVPAEVEILGEARSRDEDKLKRQVSHMRLTLEETAYRYGAKVDWEEEEAYRQFRLAPTEPVVQLARAACERIGVKPVLQDGGGGSDANIFNERGLPSLIVSCGEQNPHSTHECVAIADLVAATRLAVALVQVAGEGGK